MRGGYIEDNAVKSARDVIPLKAFMFIFPFLIGGFHIFTACLASIYIVIYLIIISKKTKNVYFYCNISSVAISVFVLSYLISAFWAVDRGMAFTGFFKFLPLVLFAAALMQIEDVSEILKIIPVSGCVMTVLSFILHFFPALKEYFTVAGRLAGFFQYPNSFAIFLICGILVAAFYYNPDIKSAAMSALLLFGVFESGSRVAFASLILGIILIAVFSESKKVKICTGIFFAAGIAASIVYSKLSGNYYTVGRFLTSSLQESTFIGRLLYYKDALPVILKHPFGLGYLGYFFTHKEFQTGVYTLTFVHNELFQFLLDVGFIPVLLMIAAVIKSLISKNTDKCKKIIMAVLCSHAFFDFDFQYLSVFLILVMTLDLRSGQSCEIKYDFKKAVSFALFVIIPCVYFFTVDSLYYLKKNTLAVKLYPVHTLAEMNLLAESQTAAEQGAFAMDIIKRNGHISTAYAAKANLELSEGKVKEFIGSYKKAIQLSPYETDLYNDFGLKLIKICDIYSRSGDRYSAGYCFKQIEYIISTIDEVRQNTSSLALKIKDKPQFDLSDEIINYYKENEVEYGN